MEPIEQVLIRAVGVECWRLDGDWSEVALWV